MGAPSVKPGHLAPEHRVLTTVKLLWFLLAVGQVTVCRSKEQGRKDGKEGQPLSMTFGHEERTAASIILS